MGIHRRSRIFQSSSRAHKIARARRLLLLQARKLVLEPLDGHVARNKLPVEIADLAPALLLRPRVSGGTVQEGSGQKKRTCAHLDVHEGLAGLAGGGLRGIDLALQVRVVALERLQLIVGRVLLR